MLTKDKKKKIIAKFKTHDNDTGSTPVQIAILSAEIDDLAGHLKDHKHDHSSRRGLLKKVSERRKLLKYLQKENTEQFADVAKKLKLKIAKKMIEDERLKREEEEEVERILEEKRREKEEKEKAKAKK